MMRGKRFNLGVINILFSLLVVSIVFIGGCTRQSSTGEPSLLASPPTEPVMPGYIRVYDHQLGYGFEYPEDWGFFINVDKDVEQCDPTLHYENYTCVDFPDRNIKKVVSFEKLFNKKFEGSEYESQVSVQITLIVKSVTDLEEVKNEFKKRLEMSGIPILNEATISVNNIDGYDILCGDSETPTWKLRQVVFFANGMAYIFEYQSQEEFYRMYEDTFNNVINSFVIE